MDHFDRHRPRRIDDCLRHGPPRYRLGVSALWIYIGLTEDAIPLAAMNGILLLINAWGVWQYWFHPKNRT